MRILHVTESKGWSGGAANAFLTARELARRGHAVAFACPPQGDLAGRLVPEGITVYGLDILQDWDVRSAWRLAAIAREWKADLLHAHHPQGHAMALLSSFRHRLPIVVHRHVNNPIPRHPFSQIKYRSARISRYVAVSAAIGKRLTDAGVEPERVSVIPACIDPARWEKAREARTRLNGARPIVFMVGHYSAIKGQDVLLEAAPLVLAKHPEVVFRFAGRGTETLKAKAERLGVAASVELLGERHDVPELMAGARLLAMPSLQEGLGLAAAEAHATGVPVVASTAGGLPEVVSDRETGLLVPPGDARALAEALVWLLEHPEDATRMSQKGREAMLARFSAASVVERLERLYAEVVTR